MTEAPGFADVPPGTTADGVTFLTATPDLAHVVFLSQVALTPAGGDIYEWSAGAAPSERLRSVAIAPRAKVAGPSQGESGPRPVNNAPHTLSSDGSRVIWTVGDAVGQIYLRDLVKQETVRLDLVQGGSGAGSDEPVYMTANSEASRVFFTDTQRYRRLQLESRQARSV